MEERKVDGLEEGRLTVSHLPPLKISVMLLAMLGFSATQSTFIPHVLFFCKYIKESEVAGVYAV